MNKIYYLLYVVFIICVLKKLFNTNISLFPFLPKQYSNIDKIEPNKE